jgi:hypothetical protein
MRKINALALIAGITTLVLIAASYFIPWWQLTVGNPALATVNFSPLNLNFELFNNLLTIPLILALNISCLLALLAGGLILIIYSVVPTKPYASKLIGYAYKPPLLAVVLFVIEVVGLTLSVKAFTGFNFPLIGAGTVGLPAGLAPGGISVSVNVSAAFLWPFYLAIAVTVLCVAARIYHRKITKVAPSQIPSPPSPSGQLAISQ